MSFFSDPRWGEALAHLPDYLGNHVRVSVTALALGLAISLPLAIAVRHRPLPREFATRAPAALSGGQRQRVGVARALAARPRIVLMDEPFGALDPLTRDALGDDFRELHRKLGLTTVMITHDMTEAILLADRVAVMRGGKLLAEGTPAELSRSGDAYVGELLRTPRRQAERLGALLPPDGAA